MRLRGIVRVPGLQARIGEGGFNPFDGEIGVQGFERGIMLLAEAFCRDVLCGSVV